MGLCWVPSAQSKPSISLPLWGCVGYLVHKASLPYLCHCGIVLGTLCTKQTFHVTAIVGLCWVPSAQSRPSISLSLRDCVGYLVHKAGLPYHCHCGIVLGTQYTKQAFHITAIVGLCWVPSAQSRPSISLPLRDCVGYLVHKAGLPYHCHCGIVLGT